MARRTVLLTGAAGRIGAPFARFAAGRYDLRLADRRVPPESAGTTSDATWIALDVADLDACRQACAGIDTIVHLAADPSPEADFYGSLLDNNVKGAFNVFEAAAEAGCRRVVYASSAQAVAGYPVETQVHPDMPVRPRNLYGASKCFGEALAACFAAQRGLSCIAVRIGHYHETPPDASWTARDVSAYLSVRDCHQLLLRCIEAPDTIPFAVVHGVSNNRFPLLNLSSTRALLGYAPEDDGFAFLALHG